MTRVIPSQALVSPSVVAGESGHQVLRVLGLDVLEEGLGAAATKGRGVTTVVTDHHLFTPHDVVETVRTGHSRSVASAPSPRHRLSDLAVRLTE